jgi:gas vesicle protein
MSDFDSRLSKIEAEVAAMREKVSFFSVIYEKFDKTLDKLDERTIEDRKEINQMISDLQDNIMNEIKAMRKDMERQHEIENKKIEDLNKWRWVVVGAATVIGWLVSKFFR